MLRTFLQCTSALRRPAPPSDLARWALEDWNIKQGMKTQHGPQERTVPAELPCSLVPVLPPLSKNNNTFSTSSVLATSYHESLKLVHLMWMFHGDRCRLESKFSHLTGESPASVISWTFRLCATRKTSSQMSSADDLLTWCIFHVTQPLHSMHMLASTCKNKTKRKACAVANSGCSSATECGGDNRAEPSGSTSPSGLPGLIICRQPVFSPFSYGVPC